MPDVKSKLTVCVAGGYLGALILNPTDRYATIFLPDV